MLALLVFAFKKKKPEGSIPMQQMMANRTYGTTEFSAMQGYGFGYGEPKDKMVALLLCLFLGVVGAHKFYEGKMAWGIAYLCTWSFFGMGVIYDLVVLATKPERYYIPR